MYKTRLFILTNRRVFQLIWTPSFCVKVYVTIRHKYIPKSYSLLNIAVRQPERIWIHRSETVGINFPRVFPKPSRRTAAFDVGRGWLQSHTVADAYYYS